MAAGKRTSAAKKTAGIKGKRITAKQRVARKKNIAVARSHKRRAGGKNLVTPAAKSRGYDRRLIAKSSGYKKSYAAGFKKSYLAAANRKKSKSERNALAHKNALKYATFRRQWDPYGSGIGGHIDSWTLPSGKYKPRRRRRRR